MNLRITDLMDDYMDENLYMDPTAVPDTKRIKEAAMRQINRQRTLRPLRLALIAAAIVVLLTGTVLAVMHYTRITDSMEENWNARAETSMTEEQKDFIEQRSAGIGESVTDQGITITVDSVTCTTDTIYLMIQYELDPEMYDTENILMCHASLPNRYVENEDFGTSTQSGGGGGNVETDSGYLMRENITFDDLPEGAALNDGKTTMHIEMSEIWFSTREGEEIPNVTGTWNFEFPLPESESVQNATTETVDFDNEFSLSITDIKVTETSCKFYAVSSNPEYAIVGKDILDLAQAADPSLVYYSVEALMEDGTSVPVVSGGITYDEATDSDFVTADWAAPIDPDSVVSLIFSDGTTEIEVPLQ